MLDSASTTSATVVNHASELDDLLLNTIGLAKSGTDLLGSSKDSLVGLVSSLESTTSLLLKYNPVYTCWLQGATWFLDNGGFDVWGGGDGRSIQLDVGLLLGNDPYVYPDNLPIVAAKGGPGGKPGCGSLPDATKNFPVRQLITNTGWGTGVDIRPNPGIGHPCWAELSPGDARESRSRRASGNACPGPRRARSRTRERRRTAHRCTARAAHRCCRGSPCRARARPHRDPTPSNAGDDTVKDDFKGAAWRLLIFLTVCVFGTFALAGGVRPVPVR